MVQACERFHAYIYGHDFELLTDHEPLEAMYGPHSKPCAQIEHCILRLQLDSYKVVHIPRCGSVADALSHLSSDKTLGHAHADEYVCFVAVSVTSRAMTMRQVENARLETVNL